MVMWIDFLVRQTLALLISFYGYSTKIIDLLHMTQRIRSDFIKIEGNVDLVHRVCESFAKRINICIANYGNHIENVILKKMLYFYLHPDFTDII